MVSQVGRLGDLCIAAPVRQPAGNGLLAIILPTATEWPARLRDNYQKRFELFKLEWGLDPWVPSGYALSVNWSDVVPPLNWRTPGPHQPLVDVRRRVPMRGSKLHFGFGKSVPSGLTTRSSGCGRTCQLLRSRDNFSRILLFQRPRQRRGFSIASVPISGALYRAFAAVRGDKWLTHDL